LIICFAPIILFLINPRIVLAGKDPFSDEVEYYLSVGLNSGMSKDDFQKKKLNLVIVLDISGSMRATFSKYYYDRFGNSQELDEEEDNGKTKLQIAAESIVALYCPY